MNPSTTDPAAPTEAPVANPDPTLAASITTTDSNVPSEAINVAPGTNNPSWAAEINNNKNAAANPASITGPNLTVTPADPNPDVTALIVKTGTAANLNAAASLHAAANPGPLSTMGHKSRKAVLYITSFFVPPLAVYLRHGSHGERFGLSILLTLLGWYVHAGTIL